MTVYSYSGLHPIQPDSADYVLGSYWELPARPVTSSLDHPGEKARDLSRAIQVAARHASAS